MCEREARGPLSRQLGQSRRLARDGMHSSAGTAEAEEHPGKNRWPAWALQAAWLGVRCQLLVRACFVGMPAQVKLLGPDLGSPLLVEVDASDTIAGLKDRALAVWPAGV